MSTEKKRLSCFVISPIGESASKERVAADKVLKHLIKKALDVDYEVKRGDDESNPGEITPQIIASILEADLIVADLSGLNPNVFYELAAAHGFARPTVLIQTKDDKIPFDVKDMRVVRYNMADPDDLEEAQKLLRKYAQFTQNPDAVVTNPLTAGARFVSVADSGDPVAEGYAQVIESISSLSSDVKRALRLVGSKTASPADPSVVADLDAMREIVERTAKDSALHRFYIYESIGELTSGEFDKWILDLAKNYVPDANLDMLTDSKIRLTFDESDADRPAEADPF